MATPFKTLITGNQDIDRVQQNVSSALNSLTGPFIGGNLLTSVSVGTSATVINHGLSRQPRVWSICDQDTNTTVWRTAWDQNSITLQAGSACTVSIWVN